MKQLLESVAKKRDIILFVLSLIIPMLFIQTSDAPQIRWHNFTSPLKMPVATKSAVDTLSVNSIEFTGRDKGLLQIYLNPNYVSYITAKSTSLDKKEPLELCDSDLEGFVSKCIRDIGDTESVKLFVWGTFNTFETAMNSGGNIIRMKHDGEEIFIDNDDSTIPSTVLWLIYILFVVTVTALKRR
ncbi:hypothetical protein PL85_18060 [Vibrio anguillarum]|uniref:Uncharacterized protein n=15 Tax=Vibrio anguillarum TaxID=55601 RepID=A0ABD4KV91_VIBAN|nr:hypothetical protein [Vibrio anguillarum]MBF4269540.1 hypothetical protein [Vibrio anguillarum]MBF4274342.1 hypothetical protein [Vibrio anguillarum]MBF4284274.1 hypothetical protein [Vibrio anguillarum]MBF4289355.1 hypothetical protein [Vibrio anguillarum]MBF4328223.1 hypothetical protein [Vibrio anguillarum]